MGEKRMKRKLNKYKKQKYLSIVGTVGVMMFCFLLGLICGSLL